jgi:Cytochrome C oxidase, cbb3-type, subunit III
MLCVVICGGAGYIGTACSALGGDTPSSNNSGSAGAEGGGGGSSGALLDPSASGGAGILNCPTTDAPSYAELGPEAGLSSAYQRSCATCHGMAGVNAAKYPSLPGALELAKYIAVVRSGHGAMPAFGADFVTDAELASDFGKLKSGVRLSQRDPIASLRWSDVEVEEAYQQGLKVWRKPGPIDGLACTNCHTPDGVELATIGYGDDAILRRAQEHLSPFDALKIRDFVHAQRRRFKIQKTCSTDWHPFQPGGTVLPGSTPGEQDASFLAELVKRKLTVVSGEVVTLDDATRALRELQAIDLRTLPIGIALPRFSEDKFNGPDHRDINDWMPPVATAPNDPASFFAKEDAYLNRPTDQGLYALIAANEKETNDAGYRKSHARSNNPQSNCGGYEDSTTWVANRISSSKRRSVLIAGHLFREELRKPGSFLARPASPFPDSRALLNPMFLLGGAMVEPPCYDHLNHPNWIASFPDGFRAEFPESDLKAGIIENASDRLTHPWMMLGQVIDQTLMNTEQDSGNHTHYWAFRNFPQRSVHRPLIFAHRLAIQIKYWTELQNSVLWPPQNGSYGVNRLLHPILGFNAVQPLYQAESPVENPKNSSAHNTLAGNLIRMWALIAQDQLVHGAPIHPVQDSDHCHSATCTFDQMSAFSGDIVAASRKPESAKVMSDTKFNADLFGTKTVALIADVVALLKKAPRKE